REAIRFERLNISEQNRVMVKTQDNYEDLLASIAALHAAESDMKMEYNKTMDHFQTEKEALDQKMAETVAAQDYTNKSMHDEHAHQIWLLDQLIMNLTRDLQAYNDSRKHDMEMREKEMQRQLESAGKFL
ncbi:unnamed protein product, partial [Amoebophrya sp. A25]